MKLSKERKKEIEKNPNVQSEFFSLFPYDKGDCVCVTGRQMEVAKFEMQKMSVKQKQEFIDSHNKKWNCPRSKEPNMKLYDVVCSDCGDKVGEVHSVDKKMTDWCNFHYYNWNDADSWHGCLTANATGNTLTIQCACGQDTRDFSKVKKYKDHKEIEQTNSKGRTFGTKKSKFKLKRKE